MKVVLSTAHLEQLFGLNEGRPCAEAMLGPFSSLDFSDGNITITSRGGDGQLRELGGYAGRQIDGSNRPQTLDR